MKVAYKLTTLFFYILLILALAITSFIIIHFTREEDKIQETEQPSTSTLPNLSTTISLNNMFCSGYLCAYDTKHAIAGITSYGECDEACRMEENCNFFTFTNFRGHPLCYQLMDCVLEPPVTGCESGPKNCTL